MKKSLFALAVAGGVTAGLAQASSHREAPLITSMPKVDASDFYMFRSYEEGRSGFVTLIANYLPLQDSYGGPNYFTMDPDALYTIHIDNSGDGVDDIRFTFNFFNFLRGQTVPVNGVDVAVPLRTIQPIASSADANQPEFFNVQMLRNGTLAGFLTEVGSGRSLMEKPFDNAGEMTIEDYASYANSHIHDVQIPGCANGRLFVGQRRESFAVNLGEVFDLVNLNPLGARDAKASDIADKNVTSLALEVPIDCLKGAGPVIGGWTTARLPRDRSLNPDGPDFTEPQTVSGNFIQVSRLGMPLVNEVVIGLPDKDRFNASRPADDLANFATYVTNPTLPEILEILFGVQAPNNFPRNDLVAAFVAGLAGLNDLGVGEMQRLNVTIPPVAGDMQDNLGALGGDLAGFPNGRRPGDDVVDIELRVAMGVLCHAFPGAFGCGPTDAPDGLLPYTDQTLQDASQFDNAFPYLTTPLPGAPQQ
ncbi:MAG: DUF4331 domain-containing protein [Chromatiales bacterium]|nr:DUF4331 domain-containing protein [Chromatiales bacterium]